MSATISSSNYSHPEHSEHSTRHPEHHEHSTHPEEELSLINKKEIPSEEKKGILRKTSQLALDVINSTFVKGTVLLGLFVASTVVCFSSTIPIVVIAGAVLAVATACGLIVLCLKKKPSQFTETEKQDLIANAKDRLEEYNRDWRAFNEGLCLIHTNLSTGYCGHNTPNVYLKDPINHLLNQDWDPQEIEGQLQECFNRHALFHPENKAAPIFLDYIRWLCVSKDFSNFNTPFECIEHALKMTCEISANRIKTLEDHSKTLDLPMSDVLLQTIKNGNYLSELSPDNQTILFQ